MVIQNGIQTKKNHIDPGGRDGDASKQVRNRVKDVMMVVVMVVEVGIWLWLETPNSILDVGMNVQPEYSDYFGT